LTVFLVHGLFDFQLTAAPQYLFLFAILVGLAIQVTFKPSLASTSQRVMNGARS
jgi:hypothetical protein